MRLVITILLFGTCLTNQLIGQIKDQSAPNLKTYLIEREIPGAGDLTSDQLRGISQQSCTVLKEMGPQIEWQHSYVTDDKVYCFYKAANEELIRAHAKRGGFPVNKISLMSTIIGPETAKSEN